MLSQEKKIRKFSIAIIIWRQIDFLWNTFFHQFPKKFQNSIPSFRKWFHNVIQKIFLFKEIGDLHTYSKKPIHYFHYLDCT